MTETLTFIGESLWFFLPAFVGNQFPGFAAWFFAKCNHPEWNIPINERRLGKNKTWPAYPAAILGAVITIYLQRGSNTKGLIDYNRPDLWVIGILFGIGIVFGDVVKSLFKRRLAIGPGERWWPFDQLDFVFGGLLFVSLILEQQVWNTAPILVLVVLLFHRSVNELGYRLGIRKVPY